MPIEKNLIDKDPLGRSLIDFLNINPQEIKVKLTQFKCDCIDEIEEFEEFYVQPELDFIENNRCEINFKFTNKNKEYAVFLSSNKPKPILSELDCLTFVCKK